MNKEVKLVKAIVLAALGISLIFYSPFVFWYGYNNGLAPLGLPELGYWYCFGFYALLSMPLSSLSTGIIRVLQCVENDKEASAEMVIRSVLYHSFALLIFYLTF